MVRIPHIPKPRNAMAKRQLELRQSLWPTVPEDWLWSRHTHDGFTSVPKGMPLILSIMDDLSKGQPVSSTYFELWCRTFDESFVTLSKPREMAFHAGFDGQRAERTWRGRLDTLQRLYFIDLKEGSAGPASYALLYDPYKVVKWHVDNKTPGVRKDKYNSLLERAAEVKEHSLSPPAPGATPMPAPAPTVVTAPASVVTAPAPIVPTPTPFVPPNNWPGGVDPNKKATPA